LWQCQHRNILWKYHRRSWNSVMQPCTIRQTVRLGRRSTGGPRNTMRLGCASTGAANRPRASAFIFDVHFCLYVGIIGNLIDFLALRIFKVPTLRAEIPPETRTRKALSDFRLRALCATATSFKHHEPPPANGKHLRVKSVIRGVMTVNRYATRRIDESVKVVLKRLQNVMKRNKITDGKTARTTDARVCLQLKCFMKSQRPVSRAMHSSIGDRVKYQFAMRFRTFDDQTR